MDPKINDSEINSSEQGLLEFMDASGACTMDVEITAKVRFKNRNGKSFNVKRVAKGGVPVVMIGDTGEINYKLDVDLRDPRRQRKDDAK